MHIITKILVTAFALLITTKILSGITVDSLESLFLASLVLGVLNAVVRPVLVLLTLPITILSLGAFILFINAGLFYGASTFVPGFTVDSLFTALVGSLLVSIISLVTNRFLS